MAVINLESLAPRAQSTTGLRVTGTTHTDSNAANDLTPVSMSWERHPAPQFLRTEVQPRSRRDWVDVIVDVDRAGIRAGRSGSFTGVLARRSPAYAGRSPSSTAAWGKGYCRALPPTLLSADFPQRPFTPPLWAERQEGSLSLPRSQPLSKRGAMRAAWFMPRGGTFPASTRGKGGK